jgi:hypothetical protein
MMIVVAVFALAALVLTPAAPVAAIEVGFDVRFTGVIETVGSETEDWVVGGQTLETDDSTQIVKLVDPVSAGQWADVAAEKQSDGSLLAKQITVRKEQVRLRGVLSSKPDEGVEGEWVIAGVSVEATADTKVSSRSGEPTVGKWVEAVMSEDGGILTAHQIMAIGDQDAVIVSGEIQEVTDEYWLISGIQLLIETEGGDKTLISGTPVVGLIGHGAAQQQADDTLLASILRVAWIDRDALVPVVEFTGEVTAVDVTRLPKTITVETTDPAMTYTVLLMPNSRIHQEKGLLMVGATVFVAGWQFEMGQVIASEVTVLESPEEGGEFVIFRGEITALPAGGVLGSWKVGDHEIIVNEQTQLIGHAPKVGAWAIGGGVERADGTILAGRITVFAPRQLGTVTPPP